MNVVVIQINFSKSIFKIIWSWRWKIPLWKNFFSFNFDIFYAVFRFRQILFIIFVWLSHVSVGNFELYGQWRYFSTNFLCLFMSIKIDLLAKLGDFLLKHFWKFYYWFFCVCQFDLNWVCWSHMFLVYDKFMAFDFCYKFIWILIQISRTWE